MKKWQKWLLGIIGVIVVVIVIFVSLFWSTIRILQGTGEVSGQKDTIPKVVSRELKPLSKGDTDWISWLGANGDNRSRVTGIIKDWSGGLKKLWEVSYLCHGDGSATWSAPVIQGNRLIVCGRDTENDLIFCIDPKNGDLLWQGSYRAKAISSHGAGARATPFIEDDRVYTYGRSGDIVCWSLLAGEQLWKTNVNEQGGEEPTWGHASSPLILGEYVIVQGGGSVQIIAFDKKTGEVAWKSGQGIAGYAAITSMDIDDTVVILAFHGKGLAALDARNGNELWNFPWETNYDVNATTPVIIGDSVFITSGYKVGCALLKVNRGGAEMLWQNQAIAAIHSDPYIIDGYIYGYSGDSYQNRGAFKCISLKNGEEKWTTNEMGWGTGSFVDDHLICCDIKGNLFLMKPDPNEFIKISQLRKALGNVKGPVWTKPVVANGLLYLRFNQRLVCYELVKR